MKLSPYLRQVREALELPLHLLDLLRSQQPKLPHANERIRVCHPELSRDAVEDGEDCR